MSTLNLYVVRYWKPFPQSEHGGVEGYVAENREQVEEMILETVDDWDAETIFDHKERIQKVVSNAQVFVLQDTMPTGLQFKFRT